MTLSYKYDLNRDDAVQLRDEGCDAVDHLTDKLNILGRLHLGNHNRLQSARTELYVDIQIARASKKMNVRRRFFLSCTMAMRIL